MTGIKFTHNLFRHLDLIVEISRNKEKPIDNLLSVTTEEVEK